MEYEFPKSKVKIRLDIIFGGWDITEWPTPPEPHSGPVDWSDLEAMYAATPQEPRKQPARPIYDEYIQSEAWQLKRRAALKRAGGKCQACPNYNRKPLHCHHNTYDRLGDERDTDLVIFCEECHDVFHKYRNFV